MKIAYTGLDLPAGKIKHRDEIFTALVEKFQPAKVSPYYFELLPDDYEAAAAIAIHGDEILELLIPDLEKVENRLSRADDPEERQVLEKCRAWLEEGKPICGLPLDERERAAVRALGLPSFTPTVVYDDPSPDPALVCREAMAAAGMMFFYTVGKQEVHAWLTEQNAPAVDCAGRIHSDLARGFIRAEIIGFREMMTAHNFQDARSKNLTRLVERDYPVPEESIIDIRFSV
jgi:ribosome-binding ATPase